jgi:hypothetical protein
MKALALATLLLLPLPVLSQDGPLTTTEAVKTHAGMQATVIFKVEKGFVLVGGTNLPGSEMPFGMMPAMKEGDPHFSVLVSGDLAKILARLNVYHLGKGGLLEGKTIQVTGKVIEFPPAPGKPGEKRTYQIQVSRWEDFKIVPQPGDASLR